MTAVADFSPGSLLRVLDGRSQVSFIDVVQPVAPPLKNRVRDANSIMVEDRAAKIERVETFFNEARDEAEDDGLPKVGQDAADLCLKIARLVVERTFWSRQITVGATVKADGGATVIVRHQRKLRRLDFVISPDGRNVKLFSTDDALAVVERSIAGDPSKATDPWVRWLSA